VVHNHLPQHGAVAPPEEARPPPRGHTSRVSDRATSA
jgi:hypothetical protein